MTSNNVVNEFIEELTKIENEIRLLNDDRKALIDDYKDRINMKAMKAALRIAKIRAKLGEDEPDCDTYLNEVEGKLE